MSSKKPGSKADPKASVVATADVDEDTGPSAEEVSKSLNNINDNEMKLAVLQWLKGVSE
jgi:hypothetical protein